MKVRWCEPGAVLGAGTILTRSTPLYDLVRGEIYRATSEGPLEVPGMRGRGPGVARGQEGCSGRVGNLFIHTGDCEVPRREDRQRN